MATKQPQVVDLASSDEENSAPNVAARRGVTSKKSAKDVICIDCEEEDDDSAAVPLTASASLSAAAAQSRNKEQEIADVAPPEMGRFKTDKSGDNDDEEDDEDVAIVGATGPNALVDFPHSREDCVTNPHAQDPARHCPNCHCYVCDILASSCPDWQSHCHATHGNEKWRKMREQVRYRNNGGATPWNSRPNLDEYSLDALLQAVASVHPVEISPRARVFAASLHHFQQQSLSFMLEEETRQVADGQIRGGFLCDGHGMGKSEVVLALISANPLPLNECPPSTQIRDHYHSGGGDMLKLKTTVIMTSVSLLGQWEDECRKHAPGLKVGTYHSPSGNTISYEHLHDLDVIVSTSTFAWELQITNKFKFHRVVADESHLFSTKRQSAKIDIANKKVSDIRWAITATPFVSSIQQMDRQLQFLSGGDEQHFHLHESVRSCIDSYLHETEKKQYFYSLVDVLKKCMVRHTTSEVDLLA